MISGLKRLASTVREGRRALSLAFAVNWLRLKDRLTRFAIRVAWAIIIRMDDIRSAAELPPYHPLDKFPANTTIRVRRSPPLRR